MRINLETLEYKNFRSSGNSPITIQLNKHKTTLICGSNGSGKTTVMSALCFGLFGKGYGIITKPELVNSINQKQLLVTVTFTIGKKCYKIIRGMKPTIFEIYENDVLINQDPDSRDYQKYLEQQILKMNYRSFTQVIMIGGGDDYVPFMRLTAKERRDFVEDLLDIRIFSTMNVLAKEQTKRIKEKIKDGEAILRSLKEKVTLQNDFVKKLKKEQGETIDALNEDIDRINAENDILFSEISSFQEEIKSLNYNDSETIETRDKLAEIRLEIKTLEKKILSNNEKKDFYKSLDVCPTCTQHVDDNHKISIVNGVDQEIISSEDAIGGYIVFLDVMNKKMEECKRVREDVDSIQTKLDKKNQTLHSNQQLIKMSLTRLQQITNNSSSIDDELEKMKEFSKQFVEEEKNKSKLMKSLQLYEFVLQMLTDSGIKSKIVKQYIPMINGLINKYLDDFDFYVNFTLDEEFNETIKSRHRDLFTYNSFSAGQKRRIDIAILMAWRAIAKSKSAIDCSLLFMDELDAPLDSDGADMMHAMLKVCAADNIFLISHKGDVLRDRVENVIKFELVNNFSELSLDC